MTKSEPMTTEWSKPTLGRIVLVKTPGKLINGQDEHAAIITQVWNADDGLINVTVFPGSGLPVDHGSIFPEGSELAGDNAVTWRWPPMLSVHYSMAVPIVPAENIP